MFIRFINSNRFLKVSSALAALTLLSSCGSGGKGQADLASLSSESQTAAAASTAAPRGLEVHYDFLAREELRVKPVQLGILSAAEMVIPAGTPLTILETKLDDSLGTIVHLGMRADAELNLPADAWVLLNDALLFSLQTKEPVAVAQE